MPAGSSRASASPSTRTRPLRKTLRFLNRLDVLLGVYVLVALGAGLGEVLKGPRSYAGIEYTHYNNFVLFRNSFLHLAEGLDLYAFYVNEAFDLFKYSPAFAVLMAPFALLSEVPAFLLWSVVNALALYAGVRGLPLSDERRGWILWFVLLELVTSLQNAQSNGLTAGLMILVVVALEKRKPGWAALAALVAFHVKLFGVATAVLFVMYPGRRRFVAAGLGWFFLLLALPLLATSPESLAMQYRGWVELLSRDSGGHGMSVIGILHYWLDWDPPRKLLIGLAGLALLAPLLRRSCWGRVSFRMTLLSSILVWVVIFNHMAESPTFVIAMSGIGIWAFMRPRDLADRLALTSCYVFTTLSPTSAFPRYLHRFLPFEVKAVFPILIWLQMQSELWRGPARGGEKSP